jgi:hypothetical protein
MPLSRVEVLGLGFSLPHHRMAPSSDCSLSRLFQHITHAEKQSQAVLSAGLLNSRLTLSSTRLILVGLLHHSWGEERSHTHSLDHSLDYEMKVIIAYTSQDWGQRTFSFINIRCYIYAP